MAHFKADTDFVLCVLKVINGLVTLLLLIALFAISAVFPDDPIMIGGWYVIMIVGYIYYVWCMKKLGDNVIDKMKNKDSNN